ncbi:MAG TPA: hypothetical protein VMH33_04765 [Solirubrobacterales bacterium]|nr:hypothetical protein [Solirubrobacterales bacterium]
MQGEAGTLWTPACLSCGWVGTGGPRRAAEAEGSRHEADEAAPIVIARRPVANHRRSPGRRPRPPVD